jgi:hypothetical protein
MYQNSFNEISFIYFVYFVIKAAILFLKVFQTFHIQMARIDHVIKESFLAGTTVLNTKIYLLNLHHPVPSSNIL